jgi:hypothetical protein
MPKVQFVNENVTVDVERGRLLSDVAKELGIPICRQSFGWTGVGDYTIWVQGEPGSASPKTLGERLKRMTGWRRQANRARVLGDLRVWTQQGLASRNDFARNIDAVPNPSSDPAALRHAADEAGTSAHPYGDPSALDPGPSTAAASEPPPPADPPAKSPPKGKTAPSPDE